MNSEFDIDLDEEYVEQTRKIIKKRKDILSFLPTVFMVILLFCISSVSALIKVEFSINEVVWPALMISIILRLATLLAAQWIGADGRYHVDQKNDDVKRAKKRFVEASEKIDITVFDRWIFRENIRRKTEAYQGRNNKKIAELDIRINRIKRKLMLAPSEKQKSKLRKLTQKKEDIEAINSDEFVRRHILDMRVTYKALRSSDFLTPSEFLSEKGEKYHMSEAQENMREIARFIPLSVFITLLSSLVGYNYYFGTLNILAIIFDTFSVALNFTTGWYYVGRRTVSTQIFVFCSRKAVIDRHLAEIAPKEEVMSQEVKREEPVGTLLPVSATE